MNDAYTQGIDRQYLLDARDREDRLKLELEAAQQEVSQLKRLAISHAFTLLELNSLLEAESAKTHFELTTRQTAETTTRHHLAETREAQRNEKIANQHCEAAELEIVGLQREITTERRTKATANRLLGQLREDLGQAEANRKCADEQLDAAKGEMYTLSHDLATSTTRVSVLEHQAQEMGEIILTQHQRVEFTETALRTMASQLEDSNMKLCDSMERYEDLEALHKKCTISTAAAAAELGEPQADKRSLHRLHRRSNPEKRERRASSSNLRQVPCSDESMADSMTNKLTLRTVETQKDTAPGTPVYSEPAKLTPAPASSVLCPVEFPKTSGKMLNGPRDIWRDPPWRLLYWLRPHSLRVLCRICLGR